MSDTTPMVEWLEQVASALAEACPGYQVTVDALALVKALKLDPTPYAALAMPSSVSVGARDLALAVGREVEALS